MREHVVRMPKLGLTMEEGEVLQWFVAVGDEVAAEDEIVSIETDKVETVVTSPCAGRIAAINATPGDIQPVGAVLCVIEASG